jgi:hypothetical protein
MTSEQISVCENLFFVHTLQGGLIVLMSPHTSYQTTIWKSADFWIFDVIPWMRDWPIANM